LLGDYHEHTDEPIYSVRSGDLQKDAFQTKSMRQKRTYGGGYKPSQVNMSPSKSPKRGISDPRVVSQLEITKIGNSEHSNEKSRSPK